MSQLPRVSIRVSGLADRSKRAGQELDEVTQILTFVRGLHVGFADFAKDNFSGRICLSKTTLRSTTALAKTLELTMDRRQATQEHEADVGAGLLTDKLVNDLFQDFD